MRFPILILLGSLVITLISLVGAFTLLLPPRRLQNLLIPLVALSAGSLMGGALFHLLPEGLSLLPPRFAGLFMAVGFAFFLAIEISFDWHHSHRNRQRRHPYLFSADPLPLLILLGDGFHNFVCGLGVTSAYLIDPVSGVAAWLAAVAHEIPQELGDFGVLLHSGWSPHRALLFNFLTALTFPIGAFIAWRFQHFPPLAPLVLFAAGNFIYIAASDLVPEIKQRETPKHAARSLVWFTFGLFMLWFLASS